MGGSAAPGMMWQQEQQMQPQGQPMGGGGPSIDPALLNDKEKLQQYLADHPSMMKEVMRAYHCHLLAQVP